MSTFGCRPGQHSEEGHRQQLHGTRSPRHGGGQGTAPERAPPPADRKHSALSGEGHSVLGVPRDLRGDASSRESRGTAMRLDGATGMNPPEDV